MTDKTKHKIADWVCIVATCCAVVSCVCKNDTEPKVRTYGYAESSANVQYSIVCIQGVKYYSGHHILTPAYNTDSTIKTCD